MRTISHFKGKSQFDHDINSEYRSSACGPVTAYTLLNHISAYKTLLTVNELYIALGCTRLGLSSYRLIHNLRKVLGSDWLVKRINIEAVKELLTAGIPVAAKFDKWTTCHWFGKYEFNYHWVPVVGYEEVDGELYLLIHDNGNSTRNSEVRRVSYTANKSILSFVKVVQK